MAEKLCWKDPESEYTADSMKLFGEFIDDSLLDTMNCVISAGHIIGGIRKGAEEPTSAEERANAEEPVAAVA